MTNYTQYTVIKNLALPDLVNEVNQHIQDGWQPQGGVAKEHHQGWYFQAMVK